MADVKKWSPEPWRVYAGRYVLDQWGETLTQAQRDMSSIFKNSEDARRIVAAVNAVAGIPTEALEAWALRDAIAALQWVSEDIGDQHGHLRGSTQGKVIQALHALGVTP